MLLGLVGKPSAGKSTFFKAATMAEVAIASYPFTTIKPNHGFCIKGKRFVPVDILDVAGLVPGASEGKGLGNQFLDDLRQADVFIHILDISGTTDIGGKKTENYDPEEDIKFLEEELDKWYNNILLKVWKTFSRKMEQEKQKFSESVAKQFSGLKVKEEQVKNVLLKLGLPEKPITWNSNDVMRFASALRKESKPMIIAANKIDLEKSEENYKRIKAKFPDLIIIPCSADSELALREAARLDLIEYIPGERDFKIKGDLSEKQRHALESIKKNVLEKFENGTGVQEILNYAVFNVLKYVAIFPASSTKLKDSKGNILPDCFLLPPGSTALDFAYFLHTDFGNNFIKAIDARTKKILGKNYELKNCDALEIITR